MKLHLRESAHYSDIKILDIEGRIDAYTHTLLQEEFQTMLKVGNKKIVCNLNKVEYVGSAGLRTFLTAINQAREIQGDIRLSSLPTYIQRKFEFAGFSDICHFYKDVDEAMDDFIPAQARETTVVLSKEETILLKSKEIKNTSAPTQIMNVIENSDTLEPPKEKTQKLDSAVVTGENRKDYISPEKRRMATEKMDIEKLYQEEPAFLEEDDDLFSDEKTIMETKKVEERLMEATCDDIFAEETLQTQKIPSEVMRDISQRIARLEKDDVKPGTETREQKRLSYPINYTFERKVGEGYLGEIYYGRESGTCGFSRPVLLYGIKDQYAQNKSFMHLLLQEMQQVYLLNHQNIAHFEQMVTLNGEHFMIMEYVNGVDIAFLLQELRRHNRVTPPHIASLIIYTLCSALHYANRKPDECGNPIETAHGQICSDKVMITKDRDIKLLDLGVAKINIMLQFQQNSGYLKNLDYLAPEVINTGIPSKSGDIFALGILFYELLTGTKPFSKDQIQRTSFGMPIAPSRFNNKVNDILDGLVIRCLFGDPTARFQNFQDIALQLETTLVDKGFLFTQTTMEKFLENNNIFS